MGIFNQGLSRYRDLIAADYEDGVLGTDGTAFVATQTGAQAEVAASQVALTKTNGTRSFQTTYLLDSVTATGNTFREYVSKNASDTALDRSVFPGVTHGSNDEIIVIKTFNIRQA